ncbi:acyl-CoA thioester hydrolase [Streptomyces atratus]
MERSSRVRRIRGPGTGTDGPRGDVATSMAFFVDVTVRGYELDTQGHLNRAVYPQYAEHARWSLLRAAGLPQEKLLAGGVGPVALEVTVKFLRERHDDERARVTCQFVYGSGKTFEVVQKIIKEDGTVAAEVTGVAGMLELAARRLIADPAGHLASLAGDPDLLSV